MNKTTVNPEMQKHAAEGIHPAAKPFMFLGKETTKRNFIWIPLVGVIITVILGIIHPLKHPAPWEIFPGSWAVFGFIAYSLIVFAARPLFKLLARDETFYGEGGLPEPYVSTELTHTQDNTGASS
eukprot:GHVR01072162.1.p3 GENE.GHVR01072162.1~~GHVR01072162.1.p3  ORF type:complete len:125 (+),score=13.83 GHVR01072162.1:387-761(+)